MGRVQPTANRSFEQGARVLGLAIALSSMMACDSAANRNPVAPDGGTPDSGDATVVDGGLGAWQALAPLPLGPRQEHGVAALGGLVYAVGGLGSAGEGRRVEAYDPATNSWRTRAPLPFLADHPNVAATADRLYVLGATAIADVAEYDPAADAWTLKQPMPVARSAAATAAIGSKIYVAGGTSALGTVRDFAAYDAATDTWETLEPIPGPARNHVPGVAVGGLFYVLGGRTGGAAVGLQSRVDVYDPVAGRWTQAADMPRARGGCAAAALAGTIVVVGGEGNDRAANRDGVFPETDAYDPATDRWRTLAPMLTPRHGMGAAVVGVRLYVPAGGALEGSPMPVDILEAFSI